MKSLYQKDTKYLDVSTVSYAFGDDEPRKPKQFENQYKNGQNDVFSDPKENPLSQVFLNFHFFLLSKEIVDWENFLKKGYQPKINKTQVNLPVLGFHAKNKEESISTPPKEKRYSSSLRKQRNTDSKFQKTNSMSPKTKKQIQRFHSSAGKNTFNDSFSQGYENSQHALEKYNQNSTMDDFSSKSINQKLNFASFRPKLIKPQNASFLQIASQPKNSLLDLSKNSDEGDYGEDTQCNQSYNVNPKHQHFPTNRLIKQILNNSNDNSILNNLKMSPVRPRLVKRLQISPTHAQKQDYIPRESKLTNQERNYQKRLNIEKIRQVYQKEKTQKPNIKGIEHLILLKKCQTHYQRMQEYKRRRGLDPDTLIFCFNSRDWYIKKALERFGWIENPNIDSVLFDLKWTYRDLETDYQTLSEGQYFNHFGNNQELTMKSGLIRNLVENVEYGVNTARFFPRGYELGKPNQVLEFTEDFERTSLGNLLKNLWRYIKAKISRKTLFEIKEKFWVKERSKAEKEKNNQKRNIYNEYRKSNMQHKYIKYINSANNNPNYYNNNIKNNNSKRIKTLDGKVKGIKKWWENWQEEEYHEDFQVDIQIVLLALRCLRTILRQQRYKVIEEEDYFGINDIALKLKQSLINYSKWKDSYELIPEDYQVRFFLFQHRLKKLLFL